MKYEIEKEKIDELMNWIGSNVLYKVGRNIELFLKENLKEIKEDKEPEKTLDK